MSLPMIEFSYQKLELAKEQLNIAIELFLADKSYVSALTLAGAAEEIFGKLLLKRQNENALNHEYKINEPIHKLLMGNSCDWKEFVSKKNRIRNAVKHLNDETELTIEANIEDEALRLIVRACDNYKRLGLEPSLEMVKFDSWFFEKIVGIV